ncbi:hypothetical protein BKA62DRAFT_799382 [Auriculariales sp. MPI-PUGE-AT-0066]|nr:hypothetical protein BKA62DRAFT_799382 [Auriculariales sp. MPI-PUGE-AT-0066]
MPSIADLPYDIFLTIIGFLDVVDSLFLTSVPTLTAARIDLNVNRRIIRDGREEFNVRSRRVLCHSLELEELESVVALDGGRFVLTNDYLGIKCRDLESGEVVADYSFSHWFDVWQTRALDGGCGFIILVLGWKSTPIADGTTEDEHFFLLLRLTFTEDDVSNIAATFKHELTINFTGEDHIADVSLSREAVVFAVVESSTGSLLISLLEWPDRRLSWIRSTLRPRHTAPEAVTPMAVVDNTNTFEEWAHTASFQRRQWDTALHRHEHYLDRPLNEWRLYARESDPSQTVLAHCAFSAGRDPAVMHRTFFPPMTLPQPLNMANSDPSFPTNLAAATCKMIVWIEVLSIPSTGESQ